MPCFYSFHTTGTWPGMNNWINREKKVWVADLTLDNAHKLKKTRWPICIPRKRPNWSIHWSLCSIIAPFARHFSREKRQLRVIKCTQFGSNWLSKHYSRHVCFRWSRYTLHFTCTCKIAQISCIWSPRQLWLSNCIFISKHSSLASDQCFCIQFVIRKLFKSKWKQISAL